jgi:poly(3-hydroxybutyrate) depolymerase
MAGNVRELRPRTGDTEKITINLGYVDLGHIDLMVQEGFYSNRTDFIRTAIRNQLERHADAVKRSIVPTIVFHGDRDTTVHLRNGDRVVAQSRTTPMTDLRTTVQQGRVAGGHAYSRRLHADTSGQTILEHWVIHGAGHAWSGGSPAGSYTDPQGPDATREMLRFFLEHSHP